MSPTNNKKLLAWVEEVVQLCKPARVHWCDGSQAEYDALCELMVKGGTFTRLNEKLRPGCYLARSHPSDVGRTEDRTYICSENKDDAGPNNNWAAPDEMKQTLRGLFAGSMTGAVETPIGWLPTHDALDLSGLDLPADNLAQLLAVDVEGWKQEAASVAEHYKKFGNRLPAALEHELANLNARLNAASRKQ